MLPCRGKNLSLETCEKLFKAVNEQHLSIAVAAKNLQVACTIALLFFDHFQETGNVAPKKQGGNRRPVFNKEHLNWIQEQIDKKNDMRIADLLDNIKKAFPFTTLPSHTALDDAVKKKITYTLKLLHAEPADYNTPARIQEQKEWAEDFINSGVSLFDCVYIDESPFNLHQHILYGRAKRGQQAIRIVPSDQGPNVLLMAAIGQEGVIALWAHKGGTTGKLFAWFLKVHVFLKLSFRRHIIMDNARIHKLKDVRAVFEESLHKAVFLPPYLPFLDAAEWFFVHIKPRITQEEHKNFESLTEAIPATVDSACVLGWLRKVNRNLHRLLEGHVLGQEYHWRMAEGDEEVADELTENLRNMQALTVSSSPKAHQMQ